MHHLLQFIFISTIMLYGSVASAATLAGAFEDYREGEHTRAYQQFEALLPLANPTAALQMSLMTLDEEGTKYDPAMAYALAQLATAWKHPEGEALRDHIKPHLTDEQRQQAAEYRSATEARQEVSSFNTTTKGITKLREQQLEPLRRAEPRYPSLAAERGQIGWYKVILLVGEDGDVVALNDAGSSVTPDFKNASYRAIRRWQYEPAKTAEPVTVMMQYTINEMNVSSESARKKATASYLESVHKLWEPAQKGGQSYQYLLGQILVFLENESGADSIELDESLTVSDPPETTDYDIKDQSVTWSPQWSGAYWLNMAARNGSREAQWALAVQHEEWMRYLINQGNVKAKTWHGATLAARAVNDEDREYGLQLLREARDSGDETAAAVAAQYL